MPIDYKKYPPNWKTEIRPRILKRAANCCERCGVENYKIVSSFKQKGRTIWRPLNLGEWYENEMPKQVKVVLTVAHLDHDETNHAVKDDRLAAMCQLCHLNYDRAEKSKRRAAKKQKSCSNQ